MATVSPATGSGLTENLDFASELLLNRVMNGQLKAQSGRTISPASRAVAADLDAAARSYGVIASNVAAAKPIVDGAQSALTELAAVLEKTRDAMLGAPDAAAVSSLAAEARTEMDALLRASFDGVSPLGSGPGSTRSVTLGPGAGETMTVGGLNLGGGGTAFDTLYNSLDATLTVAPTADAFNDAIAWLANLVARQGAQRNVLTDRYDMLSDLAATLHDASDDQAMTAGGSSSSLLNTVF